MNHVARAILIVLALSLAGTPYAAAQERAPNDPGFGDQWALEQVGALCAWERTTGSADVTVAVVDSGVDMGHPDLVGRLRDDGADFVDGDDDPSDENGHGTNVAGIIAATLDNAEGVTGLAPGVRILPVRVMNHRGYGTDRAIARGIRFAADRGANVINLSLGATLMVGTDTESEVVESAIRYAQERGALVVVAAGNDFVPLPNAIVGDNPDVLVVAATTPDDRKADFSNSGPWVNIAAPGIQILSTMPTYDVYLTGEDVPRDERFRQGYDAMSGTSQAAPLVSALAALVFSARPDWDAAQVARHLRETAVDIAARNPGVELGGGRMDACAALAGIALDPAATPAMPSTDPTPLSEPTPAPAPVAPTAAPAAGGAAGTQPTMAERSAPLILAAALACGAIGLLSLLLFAITMLTRRRTPRAAPPSVPVYTPPVAAPIPVPATASPGWGTLTVIAGPAQARVYSLQGAVSTIGRDVDCAVVLIGDGSVSRRHAVVRNDGRQIMVEDNTSTHGTFLNAQRVTTPTLVRHGDVLQIGQTLLRFG
jgi:type VII secretion-associated serine protease mycosin